MMAIDVYWGSGSPYSWRVLLALEYKRLPYTSHVLQFSKQEHKSPQMLALNWRGKVPVLKDGDYVCFESLAVLYYLDLKYPEPPIFGRTPEEAGTIMRVICEYQAYIEPHVNTILNAVFGKANLGSEEVTTAMHHAASEARTIEARLGGGRKLLRGRHGHLSGVSVAAAGARAPRGARVGITVPARGGQLSRARSMGRARGGTSRLRSHLPAALAAMNLTACRCASGAICGL
jgi:glutathione S-transferase